LGVEIRAPVVALESTLISHGLPRPDNQSVAREAERAARAEGAIPATVGGVAKVGLEDDDLKLMATVEDIPKLSVCDLAIAAAKGSDGATTVAATGGLGGVHREADRCRYLCWFHNRTVRWPLHRTQLHREVGTG
jgi:pseudouridylate synthase